MSNLYDYWESLDYRTLSNTEIGRAFRLFKRNLEKGLALSRKQELKNFLIFLNNEQINDFSYEDVGFLFGCSVSTVRRAKNCPQSEIEVEKGAPRKLSETQTQTLIEWIDKKSKERDPPTRKQVTKKAFKILKLDGGNTELSKSWIDSFLRLNQENILQKRAQSMEEPRKNISEQCILDHFKKLDELRITEIDPSLILNLDETGFGEMSSKKNSSKLVIVTKAHAKNTIYSEKRWGSHISVISCISADGSMLTPGFIGINKNLGADASKTTFYGKIHYYYSKTAFINANIFQDYVSREIIEYVRNRRIELGNNDARSILIVDGHMSHVHESIKAILAQNLIEFYLLPSHTSHIIQPLDQCFFSKVKNNYRNIMISENLSIFTKKLEEIFVSIETSQVTHYILKSWELAGIHPNLLEGEIKTISLAPQNVLKKHFPPQDPNGIVAAEAGTSTNNQIAIRKKSINYEWGLINMEQIALKKDSMCPLCKRPL